MRVFKLMRVYVMRVFLPRDFGAGTPAPPPVSGTVINDRFSTGFTGGF